MTKYRSMLYRLIAITLSVAVVSCGGPMDVAETDQAVAATYTFDCPPGFNQAPLAPAIGGAGFPPLTSLATVPNPVLDVNPKTGGWALRGDLAPYVLDLNAAIQLGKALFWDVQAGSDNKVSCATCHFQAGADVRKRNQLNPGANGTFDSVTFNGYSATYSPNWLLSMQDFPFTDFVVGRPDVDNIAGSQGVPAMTFVGIGAGGVETVTVGTDPVFGKNRKTTGMNSPPSINAVFNHRNFFNGRSQPEFNGVNPFGTRDIGAKVWRVIDTAGNVGQVSVNILNASLASQAVGPPLDATEMSAAGRTFPELGKKMLLVKPLGLQKVDAKDSVLGGIAELRGNGLKTTYAALIQKAFQPVWWNTTKPVTSGTKTYTLTQANFSLFWGLSIMLYEATLVANASPMDQYVASRTVDPVTGLTTAHNPALLDPVVSRINADGGVPNGTGGLRPVTRADILLGLDLFEKPIPPPGTAGTPAGFGTGCVFCHLGAETTSASVRALGVGVDAADHALRGGGFDLRMERMFMGIRNPAPIPPAMPPPVPDITTQITYDSGTYAVTATVVDGAPASTPAPVKTYDVGWYDVGVRATGENPGLGGKDPFGKPLSWVEYFQVRNLAIKVPGGGLLCVGPDGQPLVPPAAPVGSPFVGEVMDPATGFPILSGPLLPAEATDVQNTFKTSHLRNVELTGPYFHSGGKATLRQVVELYDDGGNFAANANLSPLVRPLGLTVDQVNGLVAFMVALTDERVRFQRAPFDHPALPLPDGKDAAGNDVMTTFPAVGATGTATPLPRFLGLNPFQ